MMLDTIITLRPNLNLVEWQRAYRCLGTFKLDFKRRHLVSMSMAEHLYALGLLDPGCFVYTQPTQHPALSLN